MAASGVIGLDIGASGVRAVEVTLSKQGDLALKRFGQRALPVGAVRGGIALDGVAVTRAVKELWKESAFVAKRVNISVNSGQVAVRKVSLPAMDASERQQALPFLVRDVVPIPLDRAILDFIPTGAIDDSGKQTGLLIAIPSEGVTGIVRAVEKAGLDVHAVDLGALSVLRALSRREEPGVSAVIDLGATMTTVIVQVNGVPLMVRSVARGGDEITDTLSERLGISRPEAEEQKRQVGLSDSIDPGVAGVVRGAIGPLLSEIRSSLAYFSSSHADQQVQQIRLTGGASGLSGLRDAIARQQELPVTIADPLEHIAPPAGGTNIALFSATSASAIGLTLGGTHDQSRNSTRSRSTDLAQRLRSRASKPAAAVDPAVEDGEADPSLVAGGDGGGSAARGGWLRRSGSRD